MNKKIKTSATKEKRKTSTTQAELKTEQDEIVKLQKYYLSLFIDQSYFVSDGGQLYLTLLPLYYNLKRLGNTKKVVSGKCKRLSIKKMTNRTATDNIVSSSIKWYGHSNFRLVFRGSCLKQRNATFTPPNAITFLLFMN